MARPRIPKAVAKITGADERSPGRFKDRSEPEVPGLGPAPQRLTDAQREIWDEFKADFPWLGRCDRSLVESAVHLLGLLRELGREAPISLHAQLRLCLSSMGGTPVDRGRVSPLADDDEDPAGEFIN